MTLPLAPVTIDKPKDFSIGDVAYGAVGSSVSLTLGYGGMLAAKQLMQYWGVRGVENQSYFYIYEFIGKIASGMLRGILKSMAVVYVIILVPIIEEWFFRDLIYKWQESVSPPGATLSTRIYRIVSNGLIFGAFHFSLLLGWSNIPIVVVSTIAGIAFALLREWRGNRWASTVAHSLNNSAVLFINFFRI